ncbi:CoA ester lyase [Ensifer sp. BR816]|uniref:HpcH/HpaI aldolase/citrate lyase family protein n=1 Tax=Rhizobium sp. (strain BR816) TaxID=1057002 RepID=UPI0003722000|nr:CoA ester lyase [Ensifer sp. BR816]
MPDKRLPRWRSMLFMPAHEARFVERAHLRRADAIILDLEDSVAPASKAAARERLPKHVALLAERGLEVIVRVNRDLSNCVADLTAATMEGVSAIMLPKVRGPDHVALVDEFLIEKEQERDLSPGSIKLINLIETPAALNVMAPIAAASDRVVALAIGTEDFSAECGFAPTFDNLFVPCQQFIFACRAARVLALGLPGSIASFEDADDFQLLASQAKAMGFDGALCVHPRQVEIVNVVFRPSAADVEFAARVVEAYNEALRSGRGATSVGGVMVDEPVAKRAQALLATLKKSDA